MNLFHLQIILSSEATSADQTELDTKIILLDLATELILVPLATT